MLIFGKSPEVESDWEEVERRMGTGNCEKLFLILFFQGIVHFHILMVLFPLQASLSIKMACMASTTLFITSTRLTQ